MFPRQENSVLPETRFLKGRADNAKCTESADVFFCGESKELGIKIAPTAASTQLKVL